MATQLSSRNAIEAKPVSKPGSYFVARQPILDSDEEVFGYELLFRDGVEAFFGTVPGDTASSFTIDSSILMGLDVLCDGRRAFLNCNRDVLLNGFPTLLPPAQTVIEILGTVTADEDVIAACKRLKDTGYWIALDNFTMNDPRELLVGMADAIKVDTSGLSPEQSAAIVKRYKSPRCRMVAAKVETRGEFSAAKAAGFQYFQGYFFRRPEVLVGSSFPANKVNYLRLLQAASRPELDSREIEKLLKIEPSLCYRLLRYLSSPVFGFVNEIRSVRHALTMLGENEIRTWMRLVAMLAAGQNKASDLVLSALTRACFCEMLAPKIHLDDSNIFLMGMLSMMDAILEVPMASVLEKVPVEREIKLVLAGEPSRLRTVYLLMLAQEAGEWEKMSDLADELDLNPSDVAQIYWLAMHWAKDLNG